MKIDFGPLGIKSSSAQITNYRKEGLLGRQVVCIVNFTPKKVGFFISEVLVLGAEKDGGGYELLRPDPEAELGKRVY